MATSSIRILGVDPGSRLTGYGCVDLSPHRLAHVTHGTLHLADTSGRATIPLEDRLLALYEGLSAVIQEFKPQILSIEKVFFAKNAVSALKLGQARGAAILTGKIHGLEIVEYSPNEVKLSVVGQGHAGKEQVSAMIKLLIGSREFKTYDASDGLALAICHANHLKFSNTAAARLQSATSETKRKRRKNISLAEAVGLKKI